MASVTALALALAVNSAQAQSNTTGMLSGKAAAGANITAVNTATGYELTTKAGPNGQFSVIGLPPGVYTITSTTATGEKVVKTVSVSLQLTSTADLTQGSEDVTTLEAVTVDARAVTPIDFGSTQSVSVFSSLVLEKLPVARNTTAVALLAPGTVLGDSAFGNLPSFGGASVAENAYYVNGFNLSDFRKGVNPAIIPYEAYDQFTVSTGGYSAEYGRSLGGVISATTHSGTNDFKARATVYYEPDFANETGPDKYYTTNAGVPNQVWTYNSADYRNNLELDVDFSGPIFKNKLFYYGLIALKDNKTEDVINSGNTIRKQSAKDPVYLLKLDATPFPNNRLEYTFIRNKSIVKGTETDYDFATKKDLGTDKVTDETITGGDIHIGRYTGTFFERLTASALYGKSKQTSSELSNKDLEPLIIDARAGAAVQLAGTSSATGQVSKGEDQREAKRLDLTYQFSLLGEHQLKVGYDSEDNKSLDNVEYSGGVYWRYVASAPGYAGQAARKRVYQSLGAFTAMSTATYIEDNWTLMDERLRLRLGLRNETFENLNKNNETFVKIEEQLAPRLGISYDLFGNQKTRIFANYGRYHIPVASNTNVRLSGGELYTQEYYVLNSVNADGTPNIGAKIGGTTFFSDGSIPDKDTIVSRNLKPMYQDEIIVGIDHEISKSYKIGAKFTTRDLKSTMDDMIVDHALTAYAHAHGNPTADFSGSYHYVLGNPGFDMQTAWDYDEDGDNDLITLTADQLGYQQGKRKYAAVELNFERVWDGKWFANFSYTWAKSYGNAEGWVLSDNGQDDAGITILFDTPALGNGADGYLGNDRRHAFKLHGAYAVNKEWQLGYNFSYTSGRPINRFGWYNDPVTGYDYQADYFIVPRGTAGRTDWVFQNNVSVQWEPKWGREKVAFGMDIFNVMNFQRTTEVVETATRDPAGSPDATYLLRQAGQLPRYVRFSVTYKY